MFYKLESLDPFGSNPWKRSVEPHMNATFGGDENMFARVVEFLEPGIKLQNGDEVENVAEVNGKEAAKAHFADAEVKAADLFEWPNLLPDG